MDNPLSEQIQALTERIRNWYEHSPRARRAYEQLSADVDAVSARVAALVEETEVLKELRDKIAATIDPPGSRSESAPGDLSDQARPEVEAGPADAGRTGR